MAQIEGGGSGKKVSVELNLVPFIDLMSVLITFLLITAVWSQVSMIQIGSSIYGKKLDTDEAPPKVNPEVEKVLKLDVKPIGYVLTVGTQAMTIAKVKGEFDDEGLLTQLMIAKKQFPEKLDAVISVADDMPYEMLIKGMDNLLKAGFPQIAVATGGPQ